MLWVRCPVVRMLIFNLYITYTYIHKRNSKKPTPTVFYNYLIKYVVFQHTAHIQQDKQRDPSVKILRVELQNSTPRFFL